MKKIGNVEERTVEMTPTACIAEGVYPVLLSRTLHILLQYRSRVDPAPTSCRVP